jgi:hypothetical protein
MTSVAAVTTAPQTLFQPLQPQSGAANAGDTSTGDPSIDSLIADQQKQIAAGLASGKLTQKQAEHLQKGLDAIQKLEQDAQANGPLSDKQQQRLEKLLQREGRRIARATDNGDNHGDEDNKSAATTAASPTPAASYSTGTQPATSGGTTLEFNIDIKFQETQASVTSGSNGTSVSASQTSLDLSLKIDITV